MSSALDAWLSFPSILGRKKKRERGKKGGEERGERRKEGRKEEGERGITVLGRDQGNSLHPVS